LTKALDSKQLWHFEPQVVQTTALAGDVTLNRASAYIVGPSDATGIAVADLARRIGFASVAPYGGLAQAERQAQRTPLCFFLFVPVEDVRTVRRVSAAIRFCTRGTLRFSPLIYFSESPSLEAITACIQMGFDDVITLPFTQGRVEERLHRQIGQTLVYYDVPSYFGPDRARIDNLLDPFEQRKSDSYRRLEIIRHLATGVNVLRDDVYISD
jgi:hypothetical protein